jgi:hypothetical protein
MLAVNPQGFKFITAVNTIGKTKSADYIASRILESIEAVGTEHVVQVMLLLGFAKQCVITVLAWTECACFTSLHDDLLPQRWIV